MEQINTNQLIIDSQNSLIYKGLYAPDEQKDPREVTFKILKGDRATPKNLVQFQNEYTLTKDLDIPGVRRALAKTMIDGHHALVLTHLDAVTLRNAFKDNSQPLLKQLRAFISIADSLAQIHQNNIIHKDINSNNILYDTERESAYIIDFNIASQIDVKSQHLENPETLEGTIQYISPEQTGRMNRVVDYRTDLYSLGVTMYQIFTGQLPFESDDLTELIHMHIAKKPTAPQKVNPDIPDIINEIILKLLAKNAEDRYKTASGLKYDLELAYSFIEGGTENPSFPIAQNDFSTTFSIPEKLYGRSEEIESLLSAFGRVSGGDTELMLVAGYSGTGKSALVHEIHKPITGKRGFFLDGKYDQFQRNNPYYALAQAFKTFCNQLLTHSQDDLQRWKERILDALGTNGKVLTNIVPQLELIIGEQPEISELGAGESQNRLNYVFKSFIETIARPEHPLVLFIDDMQWADAASLNLLKTLLNDTDLGHFLVILAYRDNEVEAGHPFQQFVDQVRSGQLTTSELKLENLSQEDISYLVAETIQHFPEEVEELSELIYQKTNGNAFFVNQFLESIYQEGGLSFDLTQKEWQWDLPRIKQMESSENVVDLMTNKAKKLPERVQFVLQRAACMGNIFSLNHLNAIVDENKFQLAKLLKKALADEFIIPINDDYKLLDGDHLDEDIEFKFLHDRVQQAFYEMLDEDERKETHLTIARLWFKDMNDDQIEDELFDLLHQYNEGLELVHDHAEKISVAELNLRGAAKAKGSSAYEPALEYARYGLGLTEQSDWDDHHELLLNLNLERAEAEYLCGNDDHAEKFFDTAIERANSNTESAEAYEKKVHFYTNIGRFKDAYHTGREVLQKTFSVSLPKKPVKPAIIFNMVRTKLKFGKKPIEDMLHHKEATDENVVLSAKIIAAVLKSAYQIKPELAVASSMVMVNLCLKHGNTKESPIGYLVFGGIFLGGILGFRETGQKFARLARNLVEKYDTSIQKSEVHFVSGYFATSWLNSLVEAEQLFQRAYEYGLETGDLFHTGCSCCGITQHHLMRGVPLDQIEEQADNYASLLIQQGGNKETLGTVQMLRQVARALQGDTDNPTTLDDSIFDEDTYLEESKAYVSQHFTHYYYINKMQLLYLLGHYEDALALSEQSADFMDASAGMIHTTEHFFWTGLIHGGLAGSHNKHVNKLERVVKKFRKWEKDNPVNFRAKRMLLEASLNSVEGNNWDAISKYAQAGKEAQANGYLQVAALTFELRAYLYSKKNLNDEARNYISRAISLYNQWGAFAKSEQLQTHHDSPTATSTIQTIHSTQQVGTSSSTRGGSRTGSGSGSGSLQSSSIDINTLFKLSQTLSDEMVLSNLLDKVMTLVIENAGAQHGYLLLRNEDDNTWYLQAKGTLDDEDDHEVEIMQQTPLKELTPGGDRACLSEGIVNYVIHTQEHVMLGDATNDDHSFTNDAYIKEYQPKSILCMPLSYKGELIGLLYLENDLTSNVFSDQRLTTMQMLTSQIAISLQNAQLYSSLQEEMKERQRSEQERIRIASENERRAAELEQMRELQLSMLPEHPPKSDQFEFATYLKTATEVGGDYYDFITSPDGKLYVVVGDATGHGMGASNLVTVTKSALNSVEPGCPADMLNHINRVIKNMNTGVYKMALSIGVLEPKHLTYSSAALPPMYIYRSENGEVEEVIESGILLGAMKSAVQENVKRDLSPGDTLVMITDGLPERYNANDDQLGYEALMQCIRVNGHKEPEQLKEALVQLGEDWSQGRPNDDDITIMVVRKK